MKRKLNNGDTTYSFNDIYIPLIEDLEAAQGRDMNEQTANKIVAALSKVEWKQANAIVKSLIRATNPPRNMYGAILDAVEEIYREQEKVIESRETWTSAAKDRLTSAEWEWNFKVLIEIMEWHKCGLVVKNEEHCEPMDLDQWISADRPKTWSPVLDHYLQGSEAAYKRTIAGDTTALAQFAESYYKILVEQREKRTATVETAAASQREKDRSEGIHF